MWGGHVSIKLYCQKWVTVIFGPWVIVCQPVLYTTARNKMKNMEYTKKKKKRERERERWGEFNKLAQSPRISLWQSCVLNPCFLLPDLMFFPLRPTSLINHYGGNRKQSRAHVFAICSFQLQTLVTVQCSLPITFFLRNLHKYRRFAQLHCLFPEEMNLEARIDRVPDLQHTQVVKNTDLEPGRWGGNSSSDTY